MLKVVNSSLYSFLPRHEVSQVFDPIYTMAFSEVDILDLSGKITIVNVSRVIRVVA